MVSDPVHALLGTAYLGPVQYYAVFNSYAFVHIEQFDSYRKQTYRNRCSILAANGVLNLTLPVVKLSKQKQLVKDVKIDYSTRWQANHWKSIESAYNSSPFFEYYAHDFVHFYEKKWEFLIDFNTELHNYIISELELHNNLLLTQVFEKETAKADFRESISPKFNKAAEGFVFEPVEYSQTFGEKFGFQPNLSIIDLMFSCGPESVSIIEASGQRV